jgi:hypothetical protein
MKVLHPLPALMRSPLMSIKRRTPGISSRLATASSRARRYWRWF